MGQVLKHRDNAQNTDRISGERPEHCGVSGLLRQRWECTSHFYMNAVMTADPEHGDEVLLEMLSEEQYERFVAEELVRRAKKSKPQSTLGISPPAFEKVWNTREGKETEEYVEERRSRYADALRLLIEKIVAERATATNKRPAEYRLKPIGASLAALDARHTRVPDLKSCTSLAHSN